MAVDVHMQVCYSLFVQMGNTEMGMIEDEKTIAVVDAMAKELRSRMQEGKHATPLRDWDKLPNSPKRKWREHARALYAIAATSPKE